MAFTSRRWDISFIPYYLMSQALLLSIVPQAPVSGVFWHMKTANRPNAIRSFDHRLETFFRLLLPAHRQQNRSCVQTERWQRELPPCRSYFKCSYIMQNVMICKKNRFMAENVVIAPPHSLI